MMELDMPNPTASEMLEIERRARALRAEVMRDIISAIAARFRGATVAKPTAAKAA
jgi:hypothetical protein